MPNIELKIANEKNNTYKKYLDPDNFNVLAQAKFEDWKDQCLYMMQAHFDKQFDDSMFEKSEKPIILERTRKPTNGIAITERKIYHNSYFLTTMISKKETSLYIRFENFVLSLAEIKTKDNLNSAYFSIDKDLPRLMHLWRNKIDFMAFFVDEIKIAYNGPSNYWAMYCDL